MGDVVAFPAARIVREQFLSKRELALAIGYSLRWVQQKTNEGTMPHHRQPNGELRYLLSEVRQWLAEQKAQVHG